MSSESNKTTIICAGLSCLDLQLLGCTQSGQAEAIEQYEKAVHCAGGSASMAATTLALICPSSSYDIHILTKLGQDWNGQVLLDFYKTAGAQTQLCLQDASVSTALSVLPIFQKGGRACFFNLAANNTFTADELLHQLDPVNSAKAFLFGYPHLLPLMQGDNLKTMLESIRTKLGKDILIGVDLNGVSADNHQPNLLQPAMSQIDVLHLNEEEAEILANVKKDVLFQESGETLKIVTEALHQQGCAVVLLSLGSKGSYISVTSNVDRLKQCPPIIRDHWKPQTSVRVPAFAIEGNVNANGAGDALFAGFCFAAATMKGATLDQAGTFASLVARQRCDEQTRDTPEHTAEQIAVIVRKGDLPPVITK